MLNFFRRKRKPAQDLDLDLTNNDKLYYETIAGKTPRDEHSREEYILFIDFGSYRTSVLCWPCSFGRNRITDSWQYVVHPEIDEQDGFPSAFINPPTGDERDFSFVANTSQETVARDQIVKSAKYAFASNFAIYRGNVPQFTLYIKKIIEQSFLYITAPVEGRPWNGPAIPVITEIRVTVPDLFIENLRAGYRDNIFSVCMDLAEHKKWKPLFPENLRQLRKTFVNISSDESGACELYFLNQIKYMPFWDLSGEKDRIPKLSEVEFLFAQSKHGQITQERPQSTETMDSPRMTFGICHIDIGGLTTDASVLMVETYNDEDLGITTALKRKESFSEKKAGEYFARAFSQTTVDDGEKNWWESQQFIETEFTRFLELLCGKQAALLDQWQREKDFQGVYFLISGRPTKSALVRKTIRQYILREFNKEKLVLLPEHCMFMADYCHVGKNQEGERYAKHIENFEKLITLIGNVYTLYDGYEVNVENHRYYICLDVDTRGAAQMEITPGRMHNLETFEHYKKASMYNNVNHLAFTRTPAGEHTTRFLTVKTIARKVSYPMIKLAHTNEYNPQAWIMPSLMITNLEQNEQAFDLAWDDFM